MQLDQNYSIDTDGAGTILNFTEQRTREKEGKEVDYIFKDQWFFISLQQALNKYLDLKIEVSTDVEDCIKRIEEVKQIILNIK
jgi:hypothetical protein